MQSKNGKKPPKISVCIPVHNAELWLAEALQSIIDQSFEDWEIVIWNDASTDSSHQIINYFQSKYPEKFLLGWNSGWMENLESAPKGSNGIAITRNNCIGMARGEIICVQDADDISHKDRLKKTWELFQKHKNTDLIYGHCQYIDALGKPFHMVHAEPFDFERLKNENWIQHPTVAYRRKAALEVPYRPECRVIDDWFLYYDFHKAGKKIEPLGEVLAFYRVLPTSVSRSKEKAAEIAEMKEKFRKEAAEYGTR